MYICIEGNIGAGKSTLASALAKKLKASYVPEQFEENPLLPLFYKNNKLYGFPVEYSFLIDRHRQLHKHFSKKPKLTVSDYSIDKCLCFAEVNLSKKEYEIYKQHFQAISQTIPTPDLLVYLKLGKQQLQTNIGKRGRNYEQKITATYLNKIEKQYSKLLTTNRKMSILILTIDSYKKETLSLCVEAIKEQLEQVKQFKLNKMVSFANKKI